MENKTFRTEVRTDSDYDDIPEVAVFAISKETAKEIVKLAALVKEHGLHKVEKFDYRADFYRYDPEKNPKAAAEAGDENDVCTESDCLNVSETEFWFSAYLKHTDVEVLTERQPIVDLQAHFSLDAADAGSKIREVMMQDLVGDYDVPDDVPEWAWVEENASFSHVRNGQDGVWEFMLNLSRTFHDVPERIAPTLKQAVSDGVAYLVFHQGT